MSTEQDDYETDRADWLRARENMREAEANLAKATAWMNDAGRRMDGHWHQLKCGKWELRTR